MADRASSYLGGVSSGLNIVAQGTDAYNRAKEWQAKLMAGKATADETKYQHTLDAKKLAYQNEELTRKDVKEDMDYDLSLQKQEETKRHNQAMEKLAPIIHPPKAAPGTTMTPYQKEQAKMRAQKNYVSAHLANDENGIAMYGNELKELGVDVPNIEPKRGILRSIGHAGAEAGSWLMKTAGKGYGGQPSTTKLPGLE